MHQPKAKKNNMTSSSSPRNVFEDGKYKTVLKTLNSSSSISKTTPSPPKQLLVATPVEEGEYPVVMLLHGFFLYNSFYSQLLLHVASHGFIVVVPQFTQSLFGSDTMDDIKSTAEIIDWLSVGLAHFLPRQVTPNLFKFSLAGHSRGGKAAFALASKKFGYSSDLKISTLIGIDPVDGTGKGKQTPPPVLTYKPNSFDLDKMPVLMIGSGLGEIPQFLFPPCAPPGVNHRDFFRECQGPAWHFVVKGYGHMDMLDDDTKGIIGMSSYYMCKSGKERRPMRRFVGGIVVSFLTAYLDGDDSELVKIKDGIYKDVPVQIQESDYKDVPVQIQESDYKDVPVQIQESEVII